ncbi:CPBP family intramembrane glutamic endopeptidase [Agromyces allii]|uniref:CAAX prenyl protease 2/Lysostaphin resistance protein A-like domain-containing protein n=1 Tax=Agromyces allii TaxID=393607 RepID=A0ABN2Q004_9MICO|nr:CPBP family intramembrane glutamic endopeptidase [Agromyces allii]
MPADSPTAPEMGAGLEPDPVRTTDRVARTFWVGLAAAAVYVLLAAGLGNLMDVLVPTDSPELEFALSHLVPLPVAIALGLWFARWSGWWSDIWTQTPVTAEPPRRRWMLAIPMLLLVGPVLGLFDVPWSERSIGLVLLLALGCLLVGLGEELFYRGILRVSLRAHHGELVTLVVTSLLFGLSHSLGSLLNGVPAGTIAFQVAVTAFDGALYYVAFRATGRLWVPVLIHAITDYALYLQGDEWSAATGHAAPDPGPVAIGAQFVLWALMMAVVVSFALEDARARRRRRDAAPEPGSTTTTDA